MSFAGDRVNAQTGQLCAGFEPVRHGPNGVQIGGYCPAGDYSSSSQSVTWKVGEFWRVKAPDCWTGPA
jgi:hypothetical protein